MLNDLAEAKRQRILIACCGLNFDSSNLRSSRAYRDSNFRSAHPAMEMIAFVAGNMLGQGLHCLLPRRNSGRDFKQAKLSLTDIKPCCFKPSKSGNR